MKGVFAMSRSCLTSVLMLTLVQAAWAQPAQPSDPPVVVVRGEGVVRRAPDRALVRIGAESRARVPKEAQSANAAAMSAVLQKVAATGIPADAVRTLVVSLQQEFDYAGGRQTPRGYVARNVVEVRVDDLTRLGDVLDASVASGATSIHGLKFDLARRTEIEREALTQAVADAMARAEAAAAGAKRTVDRVIRIDETLQPPMMRPQPDFARMAAADAAPAPTPVAEGEIEIRAVVTVTAAIK
jgi:uncharacterized protein YggE